ncbi:MAG: ferritin family protein [Tuberibacillus sp.]
MPYYRQQSYSMTSAYQNIGVFLNQLLQAQASEAQAIDFYTRVLQSAPSEKAREAFRHALEDERLHYRLFGDLYRRLTNQEPQVPTLEAVTFHSFGEALEKAVDSELEAYEMYRDMFLSTSDPGARDTLLRAFTDEIEHATRFINQKVMQG